jgi:hypothetical protein
MRQDHAIRDPNHFAKIGSVLVAPAGPILMSEERAEPEGLVCSTMTHYRTRFKARTVLMAADGVASTARSARPRNVGCAMRRAGLLKRVQDRKHRLAMVYLTRESSPDGIFREGQGQGAGKETAMSLARTLSSVVAAAISTAVCGGDSVHAAAITFRCTNPKSGTTWEVKVDYDRSTADAFPAEITGSQIAWHDTLHGGYYSLNRASGALTFQNASSTGGYVTRHTCHAD